MNRDFEKEFYERLANEKLEDEKEAQNNPLAAYSTKQLKDELKRRKKARGM